jgi:capsular exopolysaccharide synthesis family protein
VRAQQLADAVAGTFAELVPRLRGPAVEASPVGPASRAFAAPRPPAVLAGAAGVLAGLLIGVALALLAERLDSRVNTAAKLEAALGVPVLAAVPRFDARRSPLPLLGRRWSAPAEAFRKLRANVSFLSAGWTIARGAVCYVITSPVADEGKSTIAANLALAAAQAGQRVVLLDGDLRKPAVHRLFGLAPRVGATTVLVGRTTAAAALQQPSDAPLSVLTSGQLPPNPAELVGSLAMEALVRELRQDADLILIDCPPILPVADPMLVARLADGVLVVARAGSTTTERLLAARSAVQRAGVPLLGAILNAVNPRDNDPAASAWYGQGIERPRGMPAIAPPTPLPSPSPGAAANAAPAAGSGANGGATVPPVTPSRAQARHARRRRGLASRGMPVPRQRHRESR